MLPRYSPQGERLHNALSLILPPGRTAHGFALIPTPSCSLNVGTITELVMNLSEEGGGELFLNGLMMEYVDDDLQAAAAQGEINVNNLEQIDLNEAIQVKMTGKVLNVSLAPKEGNGQGVPFNPISPFPSKVLYWGSGFQE